jgi:hypothetical protein
VKIDTKLGGVCYRQAPHQVDISSIGRRHRAQRARQCCPMVPGKFSGRQLLSMLEFDGSVTATLIYDATAILTIVN